MNQFIEQRIQSTAVDFFAPIKAAKLSTFVPVKGNKSNQQAKADIHANDRSLFARLLVVSRSRPIELDAILSHPLSTVSAPLAAADGTLAKTNKSHLMQAIESDCPDSIIKSIEDVGAIVIDAIARIQALPVSAIPSTFGKLADTILNLLISRSKKYKAARVDFVIDNYYKKSVKGSERAKRGDKSLESHLQITNKDVKVLTHWKSYLKSGRNKEAMLAFLVNNWKTTTKNATLILYATTKNSCYRLNINPHNLPTITEEPALACDHEEADTRLVLHASHAASTYSKVIIESSDTDVAIMLLAHSKKMSGRLALLTGQKEKKRLLDVSEMATKLGDNLCDSLIGLHAFSGCDSVSSFAGKGKKTHLNLMKSDPTCRQAMRGLGEDFEVSNELYKLCERYTCSLYGQVEGSDINKLRFQLFITKSGASQSLPPCRASLREHIKRANYVATIWKKADKQKIDPPSPTLHGWVLDETDRYAVKWHDGVIAPPEILQTVVCKCQKSHCQGNRCACVKAKLPCTELCGCVDCENSTDENDVPMTEDADTDSEDED